MHACRVVSCDVVWWDDDGRSQAIGRKNELEMSDVKCWSLSFDEKSTTAFIIRLLLLYDILMTTFRYIALHNTSTTQSVVHTNPYPHTVHSHNTASIQQSSSLVTPALALYCRCDHQSAHSIGPLTTTSSIAASLLSAHSICPLPCRPPIRNEVQQGSVSSRILSQCQLGPRQHRLVVHTLR